jgi:hypothetical protein
MHLPWDGLAASRSSAALRSKALSSPSRWRTQTARARTLASKSMLSRERQSLDKLFVRNHARPGQQPMCALKIDRFVESNGLANCPDGHGTRRSCLASDEAGSYGQSHSMRMPYETVNTTTAGTSPCRASCPPCPPFADSSRSDTMARRYNPEIIQSRRLADRSVAERRFGR